MTSKSLDPRRRKVRPTPRRGMQTLEVVLILPLLLLMSIAIFQFGIMMLVQQAVTHASTVAAREAGKGADIDELVEVINRVLSPHGIVIGTDASVRLEDSEIVIPVEDQQRGDLQCDSPSSPVLGPYEVRVTVCVDLTTKPMLNALRSYGVDFSCKRFQISSMVRKESIDFL